MRRGHSVMVKISVIMPVYNTATYLRKSIESVLNQTYTDFELICINDGSTDNSAEILAEYKAKDTRIKVLEQSNQGQAIARNKGLNEAQGQWIGFIDSDDIWHSRFLEILIEAGNKSNCSVVCSNFKKMKNENTKLAPILDDTIKFSIYQKPLKKLLQCISSSSVIWNKLYKRDLIKNHKFIEGIYFEDWPWVTCLFANIKEYAYVPYELYGHSVYNESTVRSAFTKKKIDDYKMGIDFTYTFFQQKQNKKYWQLIQKKRISASIKMMINKTYNETKGQPELDKHLLKTMVELISAKKCKYRYLPLKIILRLIKIKYRLWSKNNG